MIIIGKKNIYIKNKRNETLYIGNAISGLQQLSEFLGRLPASQHEIVAYDCQPIAGKNEREGEGREKDF